MITNLADDVQVFTSNVFLVDGDRSALVDGGANFDVVAEIRKHVDDLDAIVLTHTHPDHVGNVEAVREAFDVDCWGFDIAHDAIDRGIDDGDTLRFGDREYEALYTPGHAPDHLCFYTDDGGILFAGDLIFSHGGFGRVDLSGSDADDLVDSIDRVAERVGSTLEVLHPGHGPSVRTDAVHHVEMARQAARTV